MGRREAERHKRAELGWVAAGFVLIQVGLGLAVDRCWPAVRDPEFAILRGHLAARRAEQPDRPLVLALGSSRTAMGLRAERLNHSTDPSAPLVFNFAIPASGPMMQQVALRRLLAERMVPNLVVIETMPMSLYGYGGSPLEEHYLDPARLDLMETLHLLPCYYRPFWEICRRWGSARVLPICRHQAELRDALGIDPVQSHAHLRAGYGWRGEFRVPTPEQFAANVRFSLGQYEDVLQGEHLALGPLQALGSLLTLCKQEGIAAVVVLPPESSFFRAASQGVASAVEEVRRLARQRDVPLYDARTWVSDDGFLDGHHLTAPGADAYTERFGREVLEPELGWLRRGSHARGSTIRVSPADLDTERISR
jgi:hypothetical protein